MRNPAACAAVPLVLGAAVAARWPAPVDLRPVALGLGLLVAVAALRRADPRLVAALVAVAFGVGGWLLGTRDAVDAVETPLAAWFDRQGDAAIGRVGPVLVHGRLRRDARPTEFGALLELEVERVRTGTGWVAAPGGIRLSVGGGLAARRLDSWRAGRRVRVFATLRPPQAYRNPGVTDQATAQAFRGTVLLGSVKSGLLVEVVERGTPVAEAAAALRHRVRRVIGATVGVHDRRSGAIVTAVLIGDRAGLDAEITRRLQESGTYHVIAISGGNIAILAALLLGLGRLAGMRPRWLSVAVMLLLAAYAYVVGREASVARATVAAVLFLAGGLLDHRAPPLNVLATTAFVIVLVSPLAVVDPGFVLTFGATLGIVLGASPLAGWLVARVDAGHETPSWWLRAPAALLAATVCAEAVLLPVGAAFFGRASLAGLALNFLAIPLMTVTQVAGMGALALAPFADWAARVAGYVAHLAAAGLVESTRPVAWLPGLVFRVPPPATLTLAVYYGALAVLLSGKGSGRLRGWMCGLLLAAAVWVLAAPAGTGARGLPPGWIRVSFLDVGQADASLVQTADGWSMLVDAGGAAGARSMVGERVVVPAAWALGVRRLDLAVVTHGDPDHIGGMADVVRDLRPEEVWDGVPVPGHQPMERVRAAAALAASRWRTVSAGDQLDVGQLRIRVVHPPLPDWERPRVRNDDSVVLELRYGDVSVLLPGDIGHAVELAVSAALEPAAFQIVKMPHHGSAGSSGPTFVDRAPPCLAVVSAGRANPFGHPAPEVVRRYEAAGALVLQTRRGGAVVVETDGREVVVRRPGGGNQLRGRTDRGCGWASRGRP